VCVWKWLFNLIWPNLYGNISCLLYFHSVGSDELCNLPHERLYTCHSVSITPQNHCIFARLVGPEDLNNQDLHIIILCWKLCLRLDCIVHISPILPPTHTSIDPSWNNDNIFIVVGYFYLITQNLISWYRMLTEWMAVAQPLCKHKSQLLDPILDQFFTLLFLFLY
jgi:hypothetical protein